MCDRDRGRGRKREKEREGRVRLSYEEFQSSTSLDAYPINIQWTMPKVTRKFTWTTQSRRTYKSRIGIDFNYNSHANAQRHSRVALLRARVCIGCACARVCV